MPMMKRPMRLWAPFRNGATAASRNSNITARPSISNARPSPWGGAGGAALAGEAAASGEVVGAAADGVAAVTRVCAVAPPVAGAAALACFLGLISLIWWTISGMYVLT